MASIRSSVSTEPSIYSPQPVYHPNVRSPSLHSQTLSDYEPPGKASSLAPPSLSRGSSGNASSDSSHPPITPTDEVPPNSAGLNRNNTVARYYSAETSYGRHFIPGKDNNTTSPGQTRATAQTEPAMDRATPRVETLRRYDAPLGQRIIATGGGAVSVLAPRMQRQRSTKELIGQCEQRDSSIRVSTPPSITRRNAQLPPVPFAGTTSPQSNAVSPFSSRRETADLPRAPASHCVPDGPSYFSSFARSRGKLRHSFTNLVQLLGDKTKTRDKDKDTLDAPPATTKRNSISPSASRTFNALSKGIKLRLGKRASFGGNGGGTSPSRSPDRTEVHEKTIALDIVDTGIEPLKSGLLLYQSPVRQNESTTGTLWMPYTISIYATSLVLQIPNPRLSYLSTSKFQISLQDMYDVRSVESKDLPAGFVVPPPGFKFDGKDEEDGELYVFEVESFAGRVERFAAGDFWTRKAWVNALMARRDVMMRGEKPKEDSEPSVPVAQPPHSPSPSCQSTNAPAEAPEPLQAPSQRLQLPESQREAEPASRSLASNTTLITRSYLPNPWDLPQASVNLKIGSSLGSARPSAFVSTPARTTSSHSTRLTSPSSSGHRSTSTLMSPKSLRSMTASPSIARLDERSLVRNRLAMLERQASTSSSPSTMIGQSSRPNSVGPINWEALAEVRGGRTGSRQSVRPSSLLSGRPDSGLSMRGTVSRMGEHRPTSVLSGRASGYTISLKSPADTGESLFRPRWPFSTLEDSLASRGDGNTSPPFSILANCVQNAPLTNVDTPSVHVLGNIAPRNTRARSESQSQESATNSDFSLVSDRIVSLIVALRESDVAHSTKASGLGQLVASAQDHILQAVEDCTKTSSREHDITTGHLERLNETVLALAPKFPDVDTQFTERAERLAIKEALERVDKGVADQGSMVEKLHELKATLDLIRDNLGDKSTREDALAKIEALENRPAATLEPALVEELAQQIKTHISSLEQPTVSSNASQLDTSEVIAKLDEIAASVAGHTTQAEFLEIQRTLEEIKEQAVTRDDKASPDSTTASLDLSDVVMKLDGIAAMCQSFIEAKAETPESDQEKETLKQEANEKLMQLLVALREDAEHRTTQAEQTSELIRYSNELNAWLEKFVSNASTQMDNVGAGVGALRRDLGLGIPMAEGQTEADLPQQSVLEQLRVASEEQVKAVGEVATTLNSLMASIHEDQARNEEFRQQKATEAVLKMIEIQRQEQEQLLRKLATDLSSDIRGERLRFVEAMSQATSMNIQVHVEEFKKQLTREALALTDEVSRLRDERKAIQHQIAQLFLIKSEHELENGNPNAPPVPGANTRPVAR